MKFGVRIPFDVHLFVKQTAPNLVGRPLLEYVAIAVLHHPESNLLQAHARSIVSLKRYPHCVRTGIAFHFCIHVCFRRLVEDSVDREVKLFSAHVAWLENWA